METLNQLDAEELYHLALQAINNKNHDKAIALLKMSLDLKPDANTQYILAAEHAEIGMLERATAEMCKAIELDSSLWTAYLQLGLLYMMQNQAQQAIDAWSSLQSLDEEDPLHLFGLGLTCVLEGKYPEAVTLLERGINQNQTNPALNNDMVGVLNRVKNAMDLETDRAEDQDSQPSSKEHLFLNAYHKDGDSLEPQ